MFVECVNQIQPDFRLTLVPLTPGLIWPLCGQDQPRPLRAIYGDHFPLPGETANRSSIPQGS